MLTSLYSGVRRFGAHRFTSVTPGEWNDVSLVLPSGAAVSDYIEENMPDQPNDIMVWPNLNFLTLRFLYYFGVFVFAGLMYGDGRC